MKLENKIEKLAGLKAQIDAMNAEYEALKAEITNDMEKCGLKKADGKTATITLKYANYVSYNASIMDLLRRKAPVAITETIDTSKLKACIKSGVLTSDDVAPYESTQLRRSFCVSEKK